MIAGGSMLPIYKIYREGCLLPAKNIKGNALVKIVTAETMAIIESRFIADVVCIEQSPHLPVE